MSGTMTATTATSTRAASTIRSASKRSLSESSADELHRSSVSSGGGRVHRSVGHRKMWRNELVLQPGSNKPQPQRRQKGSDTSSEQINLSNIADVVLRVLMIILFFKSEMTQSFKRQIQLEELWLYKYPRSPDIVTPEALFLSVIFGPFLTTCVVLFLTRDREDFRAASWTWTLALCFNGIATSLLKVTVGRPRPDFFYRCFPDGVMVPNNVNTSSSSQALHGSLNILNCTGSAYDINEGFKSFPSGHSSFAFCACGFISFYVAGKLHALTPRGRGQTWRLCIVFIPLVVAALVAVSRTCDYHHHWQDIVMGGFIGFFVTYLVYRQYYPSVFSRNAHRPYPRDRRRHGRRASHIYARLPAEAGDSTAAVAADDEQELLYSDEEDFDVVEPDNSATGKGERSPLVGENNKQAQRNKWI